MSANIYDWDVVAANNATADTDLTWAEGQAPSTVNNSARVMMQRGKQLLVDLGGSLTAGGTANALTLTAQSAFTVLADGRIVAFKAIATNTGAATINVNGIGAKAIMRPSESGPRALAGGEIQTTSIYTAQYSTALNGGAGAWLLVSSSDSDTKLTYATKATNYTATASDNNALLRFTAAATLSLTAAATLGANWHIYVSANGGNVILDPNGAELINGSATNIILRGESALIVCDGTGFYTSEIPSTASFATSGYQKLPSGLILQWGSTFNAATDYAVFFPIAFPTACTSVSIIANIVAPTSSYYGVMTSQIGLVSFDVRARLITNGGAVIGQSNLQVNWTAIGY